MVYLLTKKASFRKEEFISLSGKKDQFCIHTYLDLATILIMYLFKSNFMKMILLPIGEFDSIKNLTLSIWPSSAAVWIGRLS